MASTYPTDERSKGNRLAKRTTYDKELVHSVISQTPILHVSFNAPLSEGPPFPTILPMLGAIGTFDGNDDEESIYLHGSSVARLFRLTRGDEAPVCVCGTLLDGYVLALAPFHNSCNYRSAVVFGYASVVDDSNEVDFALHLITNNSIPNRWENSRSTATNAELTATAVIKVRIETASVKVRVGTPSDEKADLRNADLVDRTWTGVVPVYTTLGNPIESEENKVKQVPEYLVDWIADVNSLNEQQAVNAIDA